MSLVCNKNWTQVFRIARKSPVVILGRFQCMKLKKFSMQKFSPCLNQYGSLLIDLRLYIIKMLCLWYLAGLQFSKRVYVIFGLFSHMIFKSTEDGSHWKSKTVKPVPLLKAGLGFLSREVAFGVLSTPLSPQQISQRKPLWTYSGVEVVFDLKSMTVSPARLVGLC